jgi:AcrR family transcriptional regulator
MPPEPALAEELVSAALALLADQPAEELSIRSVAQRVGVSHQAPYVHFGDRHHFLAAVAGAGLEVAAAAHYWSLLQDTVAANQPAGVTEAEVLRRCTIAWGTVHGIARLHANHKIPPGVGATRDRLVHDAVDLLRSGWHHDQPKQHNDQREAPA